MITTLPNSLVAALSRAQLQSLTSMLEQIQFGTQLRQKLPVTLRAAVPTTDPYAGLSTVSIFLPDDAKAAQILSAYARAGTGTLGPLMVEATGSTLAAGQCMVSPDGNINFYAADAWTSVDVVYRAESQDVIELTLPCVSGVVTLPTAAVGAGAVTLMEAQRADTSTAQLVVLSPSNSAPSTGDANLNLAKTEVLLHVADAATSVRVKLGIANAVDLNALLEAASINI